MFVRSKLIFKFLDFFHFPFPYREVKPLYKVIPQAAASVGGAMMGSQHVYDLKGAVPVVVGGGGGVQGTLRW